jgi:hypothetical protein
MMHHTEFHVQHFLIFVWSRKNFAPNFALNQNFELFVTHVPFIFIFVVSARAIRNIIAPIITEPSLNWIVVPEKSHYK